MGGMAGKLAMTLSSGLDFVGMGAFTTGGALLDGSEADGTNLLTGGKEDFSSGWSALNSTVTQNAGIDPGGGSTAYRFLEDTTTARHGAYMQPGLSAGSTFTFSIYAKSITRRYIQVVVSANLGSGLICAYFDLQTGAVTDSQIVVNGGTTAKGTPTIAAAVNGFYKCTFPGLVVNATANQPYILIMGSDVATYGAPLDQNSPQYAGNTDNGLFLWRPKVV